MDTEKIIPYNDNVFETITIFNATDEELKIVQSYVEETRYVQEIHQLFELFQYNLKRLLSIYELNNRDRIKRIVPQFADFNDRIELNALIINYISSGKTLAEAIEACVKSAYAEDKKRCEEFSVFLSSEYDSCFSYRLLTRLRDFAQHGHLPVSVINGTMCFDIAQIVETPHYRHNSSLLKEMEKFNNELLLDKKTQPQYVFTLAIAEYNTSVHRVYNKFWEIIQSDFLNTENTFRSMIKDNPDCIVHENDEFNGWLFYLLNEHLHTFNTSANSLNMFLRYMEEAKQAYESEANELEQFRKSIKLLKNCK